MPPEARRSLIGRVLREPLVHFAWLAALLIGFTPKPTDARAIDLQASQVSALVRQFELKAKRPPNAAERARLINDYLSDEVLRREAIALGLHETDPVVKRRLIQSMEYLAETQAAAAPPSDQELEAELSAHPERYRVAEQLDFVQVFVRAGLGLEERARAVAAKLPSLVPPGSSGGQVGGETQRKGAVTRPAVLELGDAFLDGSRFSARSEQQVAARFGAPLAKALFEQSRQPKSVASWLGPYESRYGQHWIWITARHPARTQRLAEARQRLEAEVLERHRQEQHAAFLRRAAARYRIRVVGEPWQVAQ